MKNKIEYYFSKLISIIGHPLVLGTLASLYVNFREFDRQKSIQLTWTLIVGCVLPMLAFLYYKVRKSEYNDFDVSNQSRRNSLYIFAILLLAIFIGYLFSTDSNKLVKTRIIPVFLLVLISYFLNKKIKVSRHTPFSFSIAVMMIKVEVSTAFTMVLFAIINGYSRLYLKRHTMPDVAIRAFLGISIGFLFHVIYQFSL